MIITRRYAQEKDSFTGVRLTVYTNSQKTYEMFFFDDVDEPIEALESLTGEDGERYKMIKAKCIKNDGNCEIFDRKKEEVKPVQILFPIWSNGNARAVGLYR